jgi:RNA polymerase subunit RPABC4/transcription elongation factor Spt4
MEITCNRCHQTVEAENCYCPACGLPQLVYATDGVPGQAQSERSDEGVRDAATIDWKPALRAAILMAVPAGILSSAASPTTTLGLFLMATASGLAVMLYLRSQRPAWITLGAGARIGLVTGILGGWLAFGVSGGALFVDRSILHQASQIDGEYKNFVDVARQQTHEKMAGMGPADAALFRRVWVNPLKAEALSPEGPAGLYTFFYAIYSIFLLFFAVAGGALGARLLARSRKPEI